MSGPEKGLRFYPASHRYRLDGRWVPGVTTLLKGIPKPALVYWSAKSVAEYVADNAEDVEALRRMGRGPMVAALKGVPWQARDEAAVRGTEVHALAERASHGEEVEVPEHLEGYVQGYVDWLNAENPEVLWTERPVGNRQWQYAGTFDSIMRLRGAVWMLDIKTSTGVYGETGCQLAAYGKAEFLVDADGNEQPLPTIERYGVLHVTEGGTHLYPITDPEAAWKDFLHAAWIQRAEDRIKSYIGTEIVPGEELSDVS